MVKANKIIVGIELVIILIPISLAMLAIGIPIAIEQLLQSISLATFLIFIITLISSVSIVSVLFLSVKYLQSKTVVNRENAAYWMFVLGGLLVIFVSSLSRYLPDSVPYAGIGTIFYDELSLFVLGAPLAIPATHVLISAYLDEQR